MSHRTPTPRTLFAALAVLALSLVAAPATAYDLYMNISDLSGDSTVVGYEDAFMVDAVGFGGEMHISFTSIRETGRAQLGPLTVAKPYDSASPMLALWLVTGRLIDEVSIHYVVEREGRLFELARTTLTNVFVASISVSANSDGPPWETVAFDYEEIEWRVTPIRPDGTLGAPVVTGWNRLTAASL